MSDETLELVRPTIDLESAYPDMIGEFKAGSAART